MSRPPVAVFLHRSGLDLCCGAVPWLLSLLVAAGSVVRTYGAADLGLAWELRLDTVPDDVWVSDGVLVVRIGDRLTGYR